MKKLVISLCTVALAAVTQASSFNWAAPGTDGEGAEVFYSWKASAEGYTPGNLYDEALAAGLTPVTLYLFDAAVAGSQSDMLTAIRGGKAITEFTSVGTATLTTDSAMAATAVSHGEAEVDYNFYMAAVVGDKLLLSETVSAQGQKATSADVTFANPYIWSDGDAYEDHDSRYFGNATFADAGWYNTKTSPTPEPTSGLLMLLGMAGLALRRRRA